MIRTQIQLDETQYRMLQQAAQQQGLSMAEIVRQGLDMALAQLDRRKKWEKARALAGKYSSGESDVARRHDDYLAEAYYDRHK